MEDNIAKLIEETSASVQREMIAFRADVTAKLDQILITERRHSALFTADALAVRGMERTVMNHDEAITELRERVRKLEGHE